MAIALAPVQYLGSHKLAEILPALIVDLPHEQVLGQDFAEVLEGQIETSGEVVVNDPSAPLKAPTVVKWGKTAAPLNGRAGFSEVLVDTPRVSYQTLQALAAAGVISITIPPPKEVCDVHEGNCQNHDAGGGRSGDCPELGPLPE